MPMRIRFDELDGQKRPKNMNVGFSKSWKGPDHGSREALDAIVSRWRTTGREKSEDRFLIDLAAGNRSDRARYILKNITFALPPESRTGFHIGEDKELLMSAVWVDGDDEQPRLWYEPFRARISGDTQ